MMGLIACYVMIVPWVIIICQMGSNIEVLQVCDSPNGLLCCSKQMVGCRALHDLHVRPSGLAPSLCKQVAGCWG